LPVQLRRRLTLPRLLNPGAQEEALRSTRPNDAFEFESEPDRDGLAKVINRR